MKDCKRLETRRFPGIFHDSVTEEATSPPSEFIKIGITEVIPKKSNIMLRWFFFFLIGKEQTFFRNQINICLFINWPFTEL